MRGAGTMNRTVLRSRLGAGSLEVAEERRMPAGADAIGAEVDGHPARRQEVNASQMETCAAGEGSSREGGTTTTLRSCRRDRRESAGERKGRKGAAASDLGDLLAEAKAAANPRKAGEKFGGREGEGGGRWQGR